MITEAGIDGGVLADAGGSLSGWLDFTTAPEDGVRLDYTPIAAADYLDQLSWYDDELRRDDYVLGCAVFNAGDETGTWASFDLIDLLPDLAETHGRQGIAGALPWPALHTRHEPAPTRRGFRVVAGERACAGAGLGVHWGAVIAERRAAGRGPARDVCMDNVEGEQDGQILGICTDPERGALYGLSRVHGRDGPGGRDHYQAGPG